MDRNNAAVLPDAGSSDAATENNSFGLLRKWPRKTKAYIALAVVCLFWGTTWVASKEGVRYMPPLQLAGIRQFLGGLCYILFFLIRGAALPNRAQWMHIIVLSFLNFVVSNGLATWALKYISAGLGSIMGAIFPIWFVIIGMFSTKHTFNRRATAGLLLGFSGICVIFFEHLSDFLIPDFRFGIFLSLAATWSWAFGVGYTKKQSAAYNPYFSLGFQMFIAGVVLTMFSNMSGEAIAFSSIPWQAWAAIAYLVLFSSVIAFAAYLYALQILPTEQVSIYAYINPIIAVVVGAALFSEKLTVFILAGVLITLYGVYLVNKAAVRLR